MDKARKLQIIKAPAKVLRTVCEPVTQFDSQLKSLADEMLQTIKAATDPKGIGLAANQVGQAVRLIVLAVPGWSEMAICNPVIEWGKGEIVGDEMCLSEPGVRVRVARAAKIRVKYQTLEGKEASLTARDLLARCIQHEIDHLEGRLLSDHLQRTQELTAHA